MMRVLLADPHPIVRSGIESLLAESFSIYDVTHVDTGFKACQKLATGEWDLLITEIALPNRDGIEVIRRVRRENTKLPILVFTSMDVNAYCVAAIRVGAQGLIHKSASLEKLRYAVDRLVSGRRYVDEVTAEALAQFVDGPESVGIHTSLTDREREIFLKLALGETVADIAEALCLAPKTIYTHRAKLLKKLHLNNDSDLSRYAFEHRLIPSRRVSEIGADSRSRSL